MLRIGYMVNGERSHLRIFNTGDNELLAQDVKFHDERPDGVYFHVHDKEGKDVYIKPEWVYWVKVK